MKVPKIVAGALPGPAVLFVGEWLDLFSKTGLSSPEWQVEAHRLSLAIGAFIALILSILLRDAPDKTLYRLAWIGFGLTLILILVCWAIWFYLGPPSPNGLAAANPTWWRDVWKIVYVATMVILVSTVVVASLSLEKKSSIWFWVVAGVAGVILAAGAVYFLFIR